jgi:hypothetical protein
MADWAVSLLTPEAKMVAQILRIVDYMGQYHFNLGVHLFQLF